MLRETLCLSETFNIAVLDLWIKNSRAASAEGIMYEPRTFAQDFVDHYFANDSQVDVWTDESLVNARHRVACYLRAKE